MNAQLPLETKVVIVGGGIVGCSLAYHLTKLGWSDVVLLEQNQLAGGTTWHAAGLVGRLRTTNVLTRINKYSAELYAGLEKETGHSVGWKQVGSLIVAKSETRMTQLRRTAAMSEWFGVETNIISAEEALAKWPLLRIDDILGAAWLPHDGKVIPKEVAVALAKGARSRGATVFENVRVLEVLQHEGRAVGVKTSLGSIKAEFVVLTGGMWTRELGLRCGVTIPLYPVEHHWILSEPIEGAFDELPVGRDPDLCLYFRGEGNAVMLGAFQAESKPWMVERVPDDFSNQLLEPDWEKFAEPLKHGKHRIPALQKCGFAKFTNGPESFTPDNNFIMGEAPELKNLFVGAGFNSVGIASAGGAGKYLAEWMLAGEPTVDLWSVDIRRFGPWANNREFLRARVVEVLGLHYQPAWPNREPETARGMRRSPLHDRLTTAGACFGVKNGWERPNWFARTNEQGSPSPQPSPPGRGSSDFPRLSKVVAPGGSNIAEGSESSSAPLSSPSPGGEGRGEGEQQTDQKFAEKPIVEYSFTRQNWFANHAFEHRACRERVAVFDQTGFGKLLVQGRDAANVLQRLCGNNVEVPIGKTVYTAMFNGRGGFESDLTLVRIARDEFYLITGTAQPLRDADWIRRHIRHDEHAGVTDVSSAFSVIGVMGPQSRVVLGRVTDANLSNEAFPFGTAQTIAIGWGTVRAVRLTYVGELGWELHVPAEQTALVYESIMAAGQDFGVANAGHYAINSLRLEKCFRAWGSELSPDDTPLEAGLGFAVAWDKPGGFLGREALIKQKQSGLKRMLVTFVLQDPEPVLWGAEPIYRDGVMVGYTTSGAYGQTLSAGVAMGYVNNSTGVTADYVKAGRYEIGVNGQRLAATPHLRAPHDPERKKILA